MATLMGAMIAGIKSAGAAVGITSAGAAVSAAFTVAGGLASIYSGMKQGAALDQAAVDEETRAVQETINGKQDALNAMRDLNRDQAAIAVAGYASGIGGEGSVEAAQNEAQKVGEQNINMARDNATIQSSMRRGQARELRSDASAARFGGITGAIKGIGGWQQRRMQRG